MKMKRGEFIALSACTMALTALGIDIMLPAFAGIRAHFNLTADSTATAQIIGFFFMGQIAQLIFGTLSDRFGRLAILRTGFPLYIIGGVVAAFAPTLEIMFASRFVAGMGASAVMTATIAGVRDRFVGDDMAQTMSLILTIFLFTPILAPFLGIAILSFSTWKLVFLTPPLLAAVVFVWSLRLPESLPAEKRVPLSLPNMIRSVKTVVGNSTFRRYTAITTLLFAGLSSYVASSERIIGEIYKRPDLFAWIFAGIGGLMSLCSLLNSRLSKSFGARRSLRWLLIAYSATAVSLFVYFLLTQDPPQMETFFIALALLLSINIAIEPNSSALALAPMGGMAGMAASVYGTCFFFIGASIGSVISGLMVEGVAPLITAFMLIGIAALILVGTDRSAGQPGGQPW